MNHRRIFQLLVVTCFFFFILFPVGLRAQIGVNVYDDYVYSYLDKLASKKLIRTYSPNQRPLSRFAVAKMVVEAKGRLSEEGRPFTRKILGELEEEFEREIDLIENRQKSIVDFRPINKFTATWTATDQPEEAMPVNNLGSTSGRVQPLLAYQEGRHYNNYANFYFETEHWLELTPYFSAYINPQFFTESATDEPQGGAKIHKGYLKAGYRDFEFQIGRDEIRWGPGLYGSLMFTDNARGLDMIRLTTPSTFRLPWVFRHIGQWRATMFFSWMGTSYQPPNSILSGYRIDYQPLFWLDIGFDHSVFMGGKGVHDPSVKTAIGEYVGFLFESGNFRASSNHLMGLDMTVRIPPLKGMELYGKVLFEDTNKECALMYKHNGSWMGGIYFPCVDTAGRLSLRGEFVRTGEYAYRHSFYHNGFALSEKFLGYDAGSDTYSGILNANYRFNRDEFVESQFRYLKRSGNTYRTVLDSSGDATALAVDQEGTKEKHFIFRVGGQKRLSRIVNLYGDVGLDYTKGKLFIPGKDELDFAMQVKFELHNF